MTLVFLHLWNFKNITRITNKSTNNEILFRSKHLQSFYWKIDFQSDWINEWKFFSLPFHRFFVSFAVLLVLLGIFSGKIVSWSLTWISPAIAQLLNNRRNQKLAEETRRKQKNSRWILNSWKLLEIVQYWIVVDFKSEKILTTFRLQGLSSRSENLRRPWHYATAQVAARLRKSNTKIQSKQVTNCNWWRHRLHHSQLLWLAKSRNCSTIALLLLSALCQLFVDRMEMFLRLSKPSALAHELAAPKWTWTLNKRWELGNGGVLPLWSFCGDLGQLKGAGNGRESIKNLQLRHLFNFSVTLSIKSCVIISLSLWMSS